MLGERSYSNVTLMGITQNVSTAYHPRMDRRLERSNQWLEQYLHFWVDQQQTNWHHYLPLAEFTHNLWKNESTGQSPFEILMGYSPRAEILNVTSSIPTIALWLRDWKRAREDCYALTGRSSRHEVSLSGVGSGISALATCDADMW